MNNSVFRHCSNSLRVCVALLGVLACCVGSAQAQQPTSISDCRAIEGELARYACYESLEEPAAGAAAPAAAPQAPAPVATPSAPARPVSNLPVVRRPSLSVGDLTGETAAAEGAAASGTAVVRETVEKEKPGLLRRLLPFGGDDDEAEAEAELAQATEAAPAAGSEVDNFGRKPASGSARLETNDEGRKELVDTVASVKTINQSLVEVTLESGQVWRQMITKRYPLEVGDTVTIRPTVWGSSYRLTAERLSGFIQVARVD